MKTLLQIVATLVTVWALANAVFIVSWEVNENWFWVSEDGVSVNLLFSLLWKLGVVHVCYVIAIALLYWVWATSQGDKPQSPCEP